MLIAVAVGALAGGATGFVAAVLTLQGLRWRNVRRMHRGEPPIRDELLPTPFVPMGAIVGIAIAALTRC